MQPKRTPRQNQHNSQHLKPIEYREPGPERLQKLSTTLVAAAPESPVRRRLRPRQPGLVVARDELVGDDAERHQRHDLQREPGERDVHARLADARRQRGERAACALQNQRGEVAGDEEPEEEGGSEPAEGWGEGVDAIGFEGHVRTLERQTLVGVE